MLETAGGDVHDGLDSAKTMFVSHTFVFFTGDYITYTPFCLF